MPFEPLRFIHAAGLLVDHQLRDLPQLSHDPREVVEDATAVAFERVVAAAIEHRADFLLLGPDTFDAADCSLRAEVLLRRSFDRLAEHDIRVFIVPGAADPASAWRALRNVPDNVTTLHETNEAPVAVIRGGKVIASVSSLDFGSLRGLWTKRNSGASKPDAQRGPLNIGFLVGDDNSSSDVAGHAGLTALLAECRLDYLALGGRGERQTVSMKTGLAHHPGSVQAIHSCETGPRGCTLIEVDQAGSLRTSYVPTGVVRRERFQIEIDEQTTGLKLASLFRESLAQRTAEPGEKIWLVDWTIRGSGPLFRSFANQPHSVQAFRNAPSDDTKHDGPRQIHSFHMLCESRGGETAVPSENLLAEFLATLEACFATPAGAQGVSNAPAIAANLEWSKALAQMVSDADAESVVAEARRFGAKWFAPASHESCSA